MPQASAPIARGATATQGGRDPLVSPDSIIARCVRHCANARDGRGRWRERDATARRLQAAGDSQMIATETAQAAMEVGAWIRERSDALMAGSGGGV